MRGGSRGLTIVELLVAAALLAVVLGLLAVFFGKQTSYARQTQARTEVQDKVRMVMQLVSEDLQMAGSSRYVYNDGTIAPTTVKLPTCNTASSTGIACLAATDAGYHDSVSVLYITGLRSLTDATTVVANPVCRKVDYQFNGDTLQRSDQTCFVDSTPTLSSPSYFDLAKNIKVLNIYYVCSDGQLFSTFPTATCPPGGGYPRTAHVTVYGRSNNVGSGATEPDFTFSTVSGTDSIPCPSGYVCYGLSRDVLLPNLKE